MPAKPPLPSREDAAPGAAAATGGGGRPARTSPRGRVWAAGALLLLALLAAGHLALWFLLAGRLEAGALAWAAGRRGEGWRVEHGPPARGGWPLAVTLAVPRLRLAAPGGAAAWEAPAGVVLRLAPPLGDPRLEIAAAAGAQRLRLGALDLPLDADGLRLGLPLDGRSGAPGWPPEMAVRAERLRLGLPAGPLEVARPRVDLATRAGAGGPGAPALRLRAEAAEAALPPDPSWQAALAALGRTPRGVRLDLALAGAPVPAAPDARAAAAWRDAGGVLELRDLSLRWGPAEAAAAAALALDAALQPAGAGTLRLVGGEEVLAAAAAAGLLAPREAAGARLLLGFVQRRPAEGAPPELEVPLVLEGRVLSLARLPLARVPPLDWPGGPPPRDGFGRAERR